MSEYIGVAAEVGVVVGVGVGVGGEVGAGLVGVASGVEVLNYYYYD